MTTPTPPPATPRNYLLRKRVIGGGIIAGVLGLGIWLANHFGLGPGLGPGEGPGRGPGSGGSGAETGDDGAEQSSGATDDNEAPDNNGEETDVASDGQAPLRVLISGTDYQIAWSDEDDFAPATLEDIVEIAVNMELDEDERRVLILHDATGESGAHSDLRDALIDAGLTELQFDSAREPFTPAPQ